MVSLSNHAPISSRRQWALVAVVACGAFITALDQTVVVTVLPAVMADLKVPIIRLESVIWVVTAYLLGYTVAMPLLGRLADVYGYVRVYWASLAVFGIGTTLVALSGESEWLNGVVEPLDQIVVARVIQAIGGGGAVPISLAIAAALTPPQQRGLALGIVAGAAEAGSMLGPAYGGAVIEVWGWRAIFWLNVPQAAAIAAVLLWVPKQTAFLDSGFRRNDGRNAGMTVGGGNDGGNAGMTVRGGNDGGMGGNDACSNGITQLRMDYLGATILTGAVALLSLAFAHEGLFRLSSWTPYLLLVGFALCVGALVWSQRRAAQPLLSAALFRAWAFVNANACQLLVGVALIIAMATTVIMANTVMNTPQRPVDATAAALWLLRMTATIPVFAIVGGWLLRWVDARWMAVVGLALIAAGMFRLSGWPVGIAEPRLTLDMVTAGVGFGLVIAPLMHRAIAAAPSDYRAVAASMVVVSRMLGMTLGMAALSAWGVNEFLTILVETPSPLMTPGLDAAARAQALVEYRETLQTASLELFHNFYRAAGVIALLAIVPAILMRASAREREGEAHPSTGSG